MKYAYFTSRMILGVDCSKDSLQFDIEIYFEVNPQCAVVDMKIISHAILHDLWIQVTRSQISVLFTVTEFYNAYIAPKLTKTSVILTCLICESLVLDWTWFVKIAFYRISECFSLSFFSCVIMANRQCQWITVQAVR